VPVVPAAATPAVEIGSARREDEITPELLVVMAAAVTAFLGKKVRIRSAKMLQSPYEIVNPWSQQGRVFVQASHNLRSRG
jgi:methylmalonyl-CoA carboxyltransferase large subunit